MNFTEFTDKINLYKTAKLGGQSSQFKLVPELRIKISEEQILKSNPRKAAILALFYPDSNNNTRFLLTKRASYKGTHSAQISFPGGKKEDNETLKQTAIRETFEEIGVIKDDIKIIRQLSETYIPPSNFMVSPFLGFVNYLPEFKKNYEVEALLEVLVNDLVNDDNVSSVELETSYMKRIEVPCFTFENQIVWGATAMILSEIKDLLKEVS